MVERADAASYQGKGKLDSDGEEGGEGSRKTGELRSACDLCSSSKKKCGGEKPTCQNCAKKNLVCVYRVRRRRGPPKGAKYKPRKKREDTSGSGSGGGGSGASSSAGDDSDPSTRKRVKTEGGVNMNRQSSWASHSSGSGTSDHDSSDSDGHNFQYGEPYHQYHHHDSSMSSALTLAQGGERGGPGNVSMRFGSPYSPHFSPSMATGFGGLQEHVFINHMLQSFGSLVPISSERSLRQSLFQVLTPDPMTGFSSGGPSSPPGQRAAMAVLWATVAVGALLMGSNQYQNYLRKAIQSLRSVGMVVCEDVVRANLMIATAYGMIKNMPKFGHYGGAGMEMYQCIPLEERSESLMAAVGWYQHIMADPMADPFKYRDVIDAFEMPKLVSNSPWVKIMKLDNLGQVMSGCETLYTKCWISQMEYEASGEGEAKDGPLYTDFVRSAELKYMLETSIRTIMESPHPSSSMTLCGVMSWYVFQRALAEDFKESIQWAELVADALVADAGCMRLEPYWHYAHVLCYVLSRFSFSKYSALAYQHNLYTDDAENLLPADPDQMNPLTCCKLSICQDLCVRLTGIWGSFDLQRALEREGLSTDVGPNLTRPHASGAATSHHAHDGFCGSDDYHGGMGGGDGGGGGGSRSTSGGSGSGSGRYNTAARSSPDYPTPPSEYSSASYGLEGGAPSEKVDQQHHHHHHQLHMPTPSFAAQEMDTPAGIASAYSHAYAAPPAGMSAGGVYQLPIPPVPVMEPLYVQAPTWVDELNGRPEKKK